MRKAVLMNVILLSSLVSTSVFAKCVYPSDRAKDGSLCGGRASSVRPGGR